MKFLSHQKGLIAIILFGLLLRVLFILYGADVVHGDHKYVWGDTPTWTQGFVNLVNSGTYSYDLSNPNAKFARVPGFAFFWGIHYLLFGVENVSIAVAITQCILDVICIYLVFSVVLSITQDKRPSLIAAFLYATYPFIILWITLSYSEILGNFLSILFFFVLYKYKDKRKWPYYLGLGLIVAVAFLTKELYGILLICGTLWILLTEEKPTAIIKAGFIYGIGFFVVFSLWPMRNLVNHGKLIFTRSMEGFPGYQKDYVSYRSWLFAWTTSENEWVEKAVNSTRIIDFPDEVFSDSKQEDYVNQLISEARVCGPTFLHRKKYFLIQEAKANPKVSALNLKRVDSINKVTIQNKVAYNICKNKLEKEFVKLRSEYKRNYPFQYYIVVPSKNIYKAFFKNELTVQAASGIKALVTSGMFFYRTLLLLIGILSLFVLGRHLIISLLPIYLFFFILYFYMIFVERFVEMKTLLTGDVLLLIPAALCLSTVWTRVFRTQ